jgi:hypothetical protein
MQRYPQFEGMSDDRSSHAKRMHNAVTEAAGKV